MARRGLRYKRLAILLVIVILSLSFLWMTYQARSGDNSVMRFLDNLLSPPQKVISQIINAVKRSWNHYLFLVGKAKENEDLKRELEKMKAERNTYLDLLYENERLKALLSLKESRPDYVATGKVIGRDTSNWFRYILIDKGEMDGLKKDMVAITTSGLVGRIYDVTPGTAKVILISDRSSSLAGRVLRSRDEGIVEGTGRGGCRLKYIRQSSELKVGDVLLSSGLDGIFPEGLFIGTITKVERKGPGLFQEVTVTPAVDLSRVEEIMIVRR